MSEENQDGLQFDEAEFEPGQAGATSACALCDKPLEGSYYTLNGHPSCADCTALYQARLVGGSGFARLVKSVALGLLAGLAGAILYYAVAKITGYELSLIAIATGWLVGKGISLGNGHRGGRLYQVLAVFMTWAAISASYVPFIDEAMLEETAVAAPAESPVEAGSEDSGQTPSMADPDEFSFASLPTPVRWLIQYPFAFAVPFLAITESPIMVFILLIGLWTAWNTNKKVELHVSGPHALAAPAPPPPPGSEASVNDDPSPPSA